MPELVRKYSKNGFYSFQSHFSTAVAPGVPSTSGLRATFGSLRRLVVFTLGYTNSPKFSGSASLYRPHPPLRRSPFPVGKVGVSVQGYAFNQALYSVSFRAASRPYGIFPIFKVVHEISPCAIVVLYSFYTLDYYNFKYNLVFRICRISPRVFEGSGK